MKSRKILIIFLTFFLLVLIWEIVTKIDTINSTLFPSPETVFDAFIEMIRNGELLADTTASLIRLLLGFFLGTILGMSGGIISANFPSFNDSVGQILNFSRFIPPLALVPLAMIWFGIGEASKVGLLLWATFFPVWINTYFGMKNVNKKHIWAAKSLGATKFKILKSVILPSAMPFLIAGARIGLGITFSVLIAAEMAGAISGLGVRMALSHQLFRVDKMLVAIIVLGILGLVADRIFVLVTKKMIPWKKSEAL